MAYRLSKYLREEVRHRVDAKGKRVVDQLVEATRDWHAWELDERIYLPAREVVRDLETAGYANLGRKLAFDLSGAATGGEAVMRLRCNLSNALKQEPSVPLDIKSRIEFLLRRLNTVDSS